MTEIETSGIISPVSQTDRFRTDPDSVGEWCNGSTYDSDSYCLGSNPSSPAKYASMVKRLRRRPLTAKTGVRVPMGVPQAQCFNRSAVLFLRIPPAGLRIPPANGAIPALFPIHSRRRGIKRNSLREARHTVICKETRYPQVVVGSQKALRNQWFFPAELPLSFSESAAGMRNSDCTRSMSLK